MTSNTSFKEWLKVRIILIILIVMFGIAVNVVRAEEPTTILMQKECSGWGFGFGYSGFSKSDCKYICRHFKWVANEWVEIKKEECSDDYEIPKTLEE